jgi:hypothetical protein
MSKNLLELMQRIRVRKYKESDARGVVKGMVEEIRLKTHHSNFRCWELMVENLAKWLILNKQTGLACEPPLKGFQGLKLEKDELYEHLESLDLFQRYFTAAKASPWDYIGEVYETDLELTQPGQNMTPRNVVEMMTSMVYAGWNPEAELLCYDSYQQYVLWYHLTQHAPPTHLKPMQFPIKTQLDPAVGTGRFLIVASQMMSKAPLVLFGIEINLSLYRACLVNMAMFSNHPFSIICGDTLRIDQQYSGPSSRLWDLGNQWDPPDISAFYAKPSPIGPDRFSLSAFTNLRRD